MVAPRSALLIELPNESGIDFFVQKNGVFDMEFSDPESGLYGKGDIGLEGAELALSVLMKEGDVREALMSAGYDVFYVEEEPASG
jgi:hypothetical protein